jgi:cytochrome c556
MRLATVSLSIVVGFASAAIATAAVKPETAIHYRQSAYTMIGWNFAPLAQMVKGKAPWDAVEFSKRAERIAFLAPQLLEGFPPGSGSGAETEAKPEIWSDAAGFKAKMDDFVTQSQQLAAVAKAGDEAKMKEQFKATAGTCKACHDGYRVD